MVSPSPPFPFEGRSRAQGGGKWVQNRLSSLRRHLDGIMKLFKLGRGRNANAPQSEVHETKSPQGTDWTKQLPDNVLTKILIEVCPHAADNSLDSSEESLVDMTGCVLCDLKDLAQCALVSKQWNTVAETLLYTNIRIEPVHYCERELELTNLRKSKKSNHGKDHADPSRHRVLILLCTLIDSCDPRLFFRDSNTSARLGSKVRSLRIPHTTRESCKNDLARMGRVTPNLRYLDLPEGFFSDDYSCRNLRFNLEGSCPKIRRMKYEAGSEKSFMKLSRARIWPHLSILEVCGVTLNPQELCSVLHSLPELQEVKLVELPWLDDEIFGASMSPSFPMVPRLSFVKTPSVTALGLSTSYNGRAPVSSKLTTLSLTETGVEIEGLHKILRMATPLKFLSFAQEVARPLTMVKLPLLTSATLSQLHYEIVPTSSSHSHSSHRSASTTSSHYTYLLNSIVASPPLLPKLRDLYVRDSLFPQNLFMASQQPPKLGDGLRGAQSSGLKQELNIFTKNADQLEWDLHAAQPLSSSLTGNARGSGRPLSMMGADAFGDNSTSGFRHSVMIGSGPEASLQVPASPRPVSSYSIKSSGSASKAERMDIWR